MSTESPKPAVRRTRLTPEREAELYEAVLAILREVGYDALTMDAVAARTHSSKATLYRQWRGKPELVANALRHNKPGSLEGVDTGTVRGDLHAMVCQADAEQMEKDTALLRGLGHAVHTNPELHRALREVLVEPEMGWLDEMLRRAVRRGELAADNPAIPFVAHMMIGGFLARPLIEDRAPDAEFLTHYVDAVIIPALGV